MLTVRDLDNILICSLEGRLDTNTSAEVSEELLDHVAGSDRRVVINLQGLTYISSMGLRVLVMAAKAVNGAGGGLKLCCATPPVRKVLEISALDTLLGYHAELEEALAMLR